jgi:hypothetical protein
MRVLRGTLTFVLGMIIGIILFVLAIGGAVFVVGTSVTVGQLQQKITQEEIIAPDSALYGQTVLDAVKSLINDINGIDSLTLQTLYDHYGLAILKGLSGIDFTTKDFYTAPIKDILNDMSIVVNSFTLNDISGIAGVDFSSYGLPILDENLQNNLQTALNNIMGSLNGDLSVRKIKDDFGIDIGTGDNKLIATIQDVSLSSFGEVVNAITLNRLLDVDTDSFVVKGENRVYKKTDIYQEVSKAELQNKNYSPALGVETFIAGAIDTDGDGTTDKLVEKELRYVKKTSVAEDGTESEKYVVDNSCYADDFNDDENEKTFYRHVQYTLSTDVADMNELYIATYANRIATLDGGKYTLVQKEFTALKDIAFASTPTVSGGNIDIQNVKYALEDGTYENSDVFYITDNPITKDSMLRTLGEGETASGTAYLRTHKGTSATVLQIVAYMSVVELQNADGLLDSLTVGDVVDTDKPGTSKAIIALKDCKITEIGTKINTLKIDELIDINDESARIMQSLAARGCTLDDLATIADSLTIGEVMDIEYDAYVASASGAYVQDKVFVAYNKYAHDLSEYTLYQKTASGDFSEYSGTVEDGGEYYVAVPRFRLYNPDTDAGLARYNLSSEGATALALQQMAKRGYTLKNIGSELNTMYFDELVRIKEGDSVLMRTLSTKNATLDNISEVVDTLKVDEVIQIDESSARIMQSLAARDCLVKDLGTVADELTLAETIDVQFYKYTQNLNGKYVKVVEEDKYVFCDDNAYFDSQRFTKEADGKYVEDANGKFAHPFYFTLYNSAEHSSTLTRYDCAKEDASDPSYNPSSNVLQRLAYSSLGDFSNAFSSLTLGDVMDIDIDLMVKDETKIDGTSYFYYDAANSVYMRQNDAFDPSSVDAKYQNFKVTLEGESSAVIKRLAYVKVDNLSAAMEVVMKDMLLSELIDVYEFSTVKTRTDTDAVVESDRFIVPSVGKEKTVDGEEKDYTFVYDKTGKYIKRNYRFEKVDLLSTPLTPSGTTKYKYEQITDPNDSALLVGNAYYHDVTKDEYVYNLALCTYVIAQNTHVTITPPSTTLATDKIFKRVASADADAIAATTYSDSNLYVLEKGFYEPYDPSNLTHLNADIYERSDGACFVDASTPDDGTNAYKRQKNETLYSKQYCENIYVQDASGEIVIINNKPVVYNEAEHGTSVQRYKTVVGYLAVANEVYLKNGSVYESPLDHYTPFAATNRVVVEYEKSEAVLRMLAKKQVTIANINDVIKDATIGDLMDLTEGSLFYDFKNSKLDNLSRDVELKFTTMTMGELLTYANIAEIDATVKTAIAPITLESFFKSLTYSKTAGIVVDLEKAYGYAA